MPTLHLGVNDLPYANDPGSSVTTGDVAEILEGKYGVMQAYYDHHGEEVIDHLNEGLKNTLESLMMGAPPDMDPYAAGCSEIEKGFKAWLSSAEIETYGIAGVPTQAALKGISKRFKKQYAKRKRRPSFIDSGLYQSSFRAWVD